MSSSTRQRLFGRIAVAILLLAALAPSISRALGFARADAAAFALICTSGSAVPEPGSPMAAPLDCPMCLVASHDALPPPPAPDLASQLLAFTDVPPSRALHVHLPTAPRSAAQPRAPPVLG